MKTNQLFVFFLVGICLIVSCKNNSSKGNEKKDNQSKKNEELYQKITQEESTKKKNKLEVVYSEDKEYIKAYYDLSHIKEYYSELNLNYSKPPKYNDSVDLTALPYDELRLLRNEIYARNGYLFDDAFLRGYFNRFNWYLPIFDVDTFKVVLNKEEVKLIDRIIIEEAKRKENKTIDQNGLKLYNTNLIVNNKQFVEIPEKVKEDLKKQNFSIIDANRAMLFYTYDENAYQYIPHYITTDLYLFILHKYFSKFLEKQDENFLSVELKSLLKSTALKLNELSNPLVKSSVEWAQMYNTLALYMIGDSLVSAPIKYNAIFLEEKKNIDNESGKPLFIPNDFVDYNELKPRGHYTKSKNLEKYFRTFKWISLNGINLDDDEELKGLLILATIIKEDEKLSEKYFNYVSTIEKIAGPEDNLSLTDIIYQIGVMPVEDVVSDKNLITIRKQLKALNKERIKMVFGKSFNPEEQKITRVSFISSTYSVSGELFSNLVHIDGFNSKRTFPRGLDIPAVFGNQTAQNIIINEYEDNKRWPEYLSRLESFQQQFRDYKDWNQNYSNKALQTALSASAEQDNYPDFMKTDAYNRKELSTTLASWTHIKHDLILYQEKPYAAECGEGGGPEPPKHYSYVEPNLKFWDTALDLVAWLEELSKNESTYSNELSRIKQVGIQLRSIAYKEISGQLITDEEYDELHYIGGTIEYILLSLLETDHLPERERSMALIADVYVYNGENLDVAVGNADDIYVVVPIKGEYYIARGSVFSYYEFTGKIFNDEEWRNNIEQKNIPQRPEWIIPIINNEKNLEGNLQYRYSER